jgi:hypothetical protein
MSSSGAGTAAVTRWTSDAEDIVVEFHASDDHVELVDRGRLRTVTVPRAERNASPWSTFPGIC